jgi:hypothetical protein
MSYPLYIPACMVWGWCKIASEIASRTIIIGLKLDFMPLYLTRTITLNILNDMLNQSRRGAHRLE